MKILTFIAIGLNVVVGCSPKSDPSTQPLAAATSTKPVIVLGNKEESRPFPLLSSRVSEDYSAEQNRIVNEQGEIVTVLKNGMVVIAKRVPSPVLAVRGYVNTGGLYEGKWLGGGLSHLLEHLVAGGSTVDRTEAENRSILQEIGNNSNAYTTLDHTAYFINTTPQHLEKSTDLLLGWLLGAKITPDEYGREYEVVQRELEKGKGEPSRQLYYLASINRYQVSPARVPVIGYQAVIQGLSRDDVYEYYKLTYQPNNIVISIAGDLEPEKMLAAVQAQVKSAPPGRVFSRDIADEPPVLSPRTVVATFPRLGPAQVRMEFPTIRLQHPDLYALDMLAAVVAGTESSIFTEEIRDKRQLVTGISAGSWTPHWGDGSFVISISVDPEKLDAAKAAIFEQIELIKKDGVDPKRLERAKVQLRIGQIRGRETAESIAASLASDFMTTGDAHFSDRYVERMQAVTPQQVQEMARIYLDPQKLITTALVPAEYAGAEGLPKAEELLRPAAPTTQETKELASEVTRLELENGVILLHKRISTSPMVTVRMYATGGLTAEDESNNGIGNLTMQMLTRGSATRSAQQINEFFDSIGGDVSAGCGNNTWFWNADFAKADIETAMEVFADVVLNPAFPESEIGPMKQRTLASIASQDADWSAQAMRFFRQQYFTPRNSPYRFMSLGSAATVGALTPAQLGSYYTDRVLSARRVLAIYGDVTLDQARAAATKHFAAGKKIEAAVALAVEATATTAMATDTQGASVDVSRVEIQPTEQPLAGVVIGFESDSVVGDPANDTLVVGDTMASGFSYPTGYLHEILRGRGLVYVVHAQNWPGRSREMPGTFLIYAGCDPTKVNEVVNLIVENIARLQGSDEDMQLGWIDRAKQLIVISDAMDNETAAEQAATAALDELYGLGYAYHLGFADKVERVGTADVRAVSRARLSRCTVTICTPRPDLVNVAAGIRKFDSFTPVDLTPKGVQHDSGSGGN